MHENVGTVNNSQTAVNMIIYQQLNDIIPDIDIWFWGHEHSAQVIMAGIQVEAQANADEIFSNAINKS